MSRPQSDPVARFWRLVKVNKETGCWLWIGYLFRGYGQFWNGKTDNMRGAHIASWEIHRGPIPEGMTVDHLCRVRNCVNPDHLEVVTSRENTLRGFGPAAVNARKTHCVRGHELRDENLTNHPKGWRECRPCKSVRWKKRVSRLRVLAELGEG